MRSVFFHLTNTMRQEVANRLSEIASPNRPDGWSLPTGSESPVLYAGFYDDLLAESESEELEDLKRLPGGLPAVSVMVDISGGVPGNVEVKDFAAWMLAEFQGVACDDYTHHCWTLTEIQSGAKIQGHPFFDYEGWYEENYGG